MIAYGTYVRCDGCGVWCSRSVLGPQPTHTLALARAAEAGWVRVPYRGQRPSGKAKRRHFDFCRQCARAQGLERG